MVGIITYYQISNYGANLQALALQKYIEDQGFTSFIVKHKCKSIKKRTIITEKRIFCNYENKTKAFNKLLSDFKKFFSFMLFRKKFLRIRKFNPNNDKLIIGSDQVWNTDINGCDSFYYFSGYNGRKYAYAASFGYDFVPSKHLGFLQENLCLFERIGIREAQGKKILSSQFHINSYIVLDPVFLVEKSFWKTLLKNTKKDYTSFLYIKSLKITNLIRFLNKNYSNLIFLNYSDYNIKSDILKYDAQSSPYEWISYIANSHLVVTNSYHCILFSIIFEKEFIFFFNKKQHYLSRFFSLFRILGISGKTTEISVDESVFLPNLDYKNIMIRKELLLRNSKMFLNEILKELESD